MGRLLSHRSARYQKRTAHRAVATGATYGCGRMDTIPRFLQTRPNLRNPSPMHPRMLPSRPTIIRRHAALFPARNPVLSEVRSAAGSVTRAEERAKPAPQRPPSAASLGRWIPSCARWTSSSARLVQPRARRNVSRSRGNEDRSAWEFFSRASESFPRALKSFRPHADGVPARVAIIPTHAAAHPPRAPRNPAPRFFPTLP